MTVPPVAMNASEALFAFVSWLTTRDEPLTLGAGHDAAPAAELVRDFCAVNVLPQPREGWEGMEIRYPAYPERDDG